MSYASYYRQFARQNASFRRAQAAFDAMEPADGPYDHLSEMDLPQLEDHLHHLQQIDEFGECKEEIALVKQLIADADAE